MMKRLEYIGLPGPHRDVRSFVANIKKANPALTDVQVERVVRLANAKYRPRFKLQIWTLFGADIMSEDLMSIDAWQYLDKDWRRDLPLFPLDGGDVIDAELHGAKALDAALKMHGPSRINRRSLLVPAGLSKTYVWRRENAFTQEVHDNDVEILRQTPVLNRCFRDRDQANGPLTIEYFQRGTASRELLRNANDLEAFEADQRITRSWKGV